MNFYVDGTSVGSVACSQSINTTNNLLIGYDPLNNTTFNGNINELRLWNVSLSASQISTNYNKAVPVFGDSPGLVGYYNFNEAGDQWAYDWSFGKYTGYLGSTNHYDVTDPQRSNVSCFSQDKISSDYKEFIPDSVSIKNNLMDFSVYPNPFYNETKLELKGKVGGTSEVVIMDLNGNILYRGDLLNNSIHSIGEFLSSGVYIIQILNSDSEPKFFKLTKLK
jgi:hypothetical protein